MHLNIILLNFFSSLKIIEIVEGIKALHFNCNGMIHSWKGKAAWRGSLCPKSVWPTGIIPRIWLAPGSPFPRWAGECPGRTVSSQHPLLEPLCPLPILPRGLGAPHTCSACTETPAHRDGKIQPLRNCLALLLLVCSVPALPMPSPAHGSGRCWIGCTCSGEGCGMDPSPRSDANNCTSHSEGMSTNGRQDREAGFWRLYFILYK